MCSLWSSSSVRISPECRSARIIACLSWCTSAPTQIMGLVSANGSSAIFAYIIRQIVSCLILTTRSSLQLRVVSSLYTLSSVFPVAPTFAIPLQLRFEQHDSSWHRASSETKPFFGSKPLRVGDLRSLEGHPGRQPLSQNRKQVTRNAPAGGISIQGPRHTTQRGSLFSDHDKRGLLCIRMRRRDNTP